MDASTNLNLDAHSQDRHPQLGQCADCFHFPSLAELHEMPISPMCGTGLFRMAGPLNKRPCMSSIKPDKQSESLLDAEVSDHQWLSIISVY